MTDEFSRLYDEAIRRAHVRGFMFGVFIRLPLGAAIGWMAR